jgi:hypothetical protein
LKSIAVSSVGESVRMDHHTDEIETRDRGGTQRSKGSLHQYISNNITYMYTASSSPPDGRIPHRPAAKSSPFSRQ